MKEPLYSRIGSLLNFEEKENYRILDIGCGRGELLNHLHSLSGTNSVLVGIDEMDSSLNIAKENYPKIDFRKDKFIDTLNFEDDSFDIVLSVDTLECIPNKSAFLNEMFRVLKPDGTVLCAHWDWDTQVYNSENIAIIRKFVAAFSDWKQDWMDDADGQMGRRLWGLFENSEKFEGRVSSFTLLETEFKEGEYGFDRLRDLFSLVESGCLDRDEYKSISEEMKNLSKQRHYFYSVNSYIYVGKPHKNV
jgi:SAM-dependent methyltransferase